MSNEYYNRDYLIECCNGIYDEAFDANSCCRIMRQLLNYHHDGYHGMDCSPVFYNTVYKAMYRACIMDLAKIYDKNSDSIKLKTIIDYCNTFHSFIPDGITTVYLSSDGTREKEQSLIQITIDDSEFAQLRDEELRQEVIEKKDTKGK